MLDINGPIGPGVSDYFHRGLEKAQARNAQLVVLRMDTPGGLDTSMREIIQDITASPVPVVSFVPSGGRAASAGTYILYASHIAAMAPGTNLGAATPIQLGPPSLPFPKPGKDGMQDQKKSEEKPSPEAKPHPTMSDKALNDAIAYIRSLAQMRGRNVEWAEKAVREAASLAAEDAAKMNVIDLVARDIKDLMAKLDGRSVTVQGRTRRLATAGVVPEVIMPDWRSKFLTTITNPNIAYILLMIGIYGLIFEFYSPGLVGPGVIGAISLLLGLYALHLLPVSFVGLALTLLGISLMVAEAFVPAFGVMGIGGVAAFVIGSVLLLETDAPGFGISWILIGTTAAVSAGLFMLVFVMLVRSRQRAVVTGREEMIGSSGNVVAWDGKKGRVRVHGEIWSARSTGSLPPDRRVRITGLEGLTLVVEPEPQEE
jgi:membrane-bound serine protease (ClpP class)